MSEQLMGGLPAHAYSGTAYASSLALTDVSPTPNRTITGGSLFAGKAYRITGRAKFSNTATPGLLLGIYHGGVAGTKLCAIASTTTTVNAVNWPIQINALLVCNSVGTSGTITASGTVDLGTSLTAMTRIPMDAAAIAAVTVDTTTDKVLTLGAQWSASSASNTLTVVQWLIEELVVTA